MTQPALPSLVRLSNSEPATQAAYLDLLFEPSTSLHEHLLPLSPLFSSALTTHAELIEKIRRRLLALVEDAGRTTTALRSLEGILGSHPRLGAKKVESALSRAEQAAAGLDTNEGGAETEEERTLRELNEEYEKVFPGLRYVVFVNARPRSEILKNMRERIARGDVNAERLEAVDAMCDIAKDRASKLPTE